MKIKKIQLGLITFFLLTLLGGFYAASKLVTNDYETVISSVHVLIGQVYVWALKLDGSRSNLQTVPQGETAVIKGKVLKENGFLFKMLWPIFEKGTGIILRDLKDMAKDSPINFTRLYTETEFNDRVARHLEKGIPGLTNVSFVISSRGMKAYGAYKRGMFGVAGSARGSLQVAEDGELVLRLRSIRVASFNLPDFLLRDLEEIYRQAIYRAHFPLKITRMDYVDGGVRVTGRKISAPSQDLSTLQ